MIEVILLKDVIGLGEEGDIVRVRDGYARNYLLPKQIAVKKNENTLRMIQKRREEIEKRKEEKRKLNMSIKEKIESQKIEITKRVTEGNKLYGSVSAKDIEDMLKERGIEITRHNVELPGPIKTTGDYVIHIKLIGGEKADLHLSIKPQE
ncbi:MAG TPA: 50S ribosomal protein L9 [Spirochaetota bacterium]|nr:50S ribosomal protein L9 [Spirochaetota bacterium]HOM38191.1 50S ribosomal protein L9 [Spirochaetota bacterium]HPQ48591.1 50S ribosomal protein L9 [Spirochaetota bacterium]